MNLTNKLVQYSVENTVDANKLNGILKFNTDKLITEFNGSIVSTSDGSLMGNFNYNEYSDGRISKTLNSVSLYDESVVSTLISSSITDIKEQINNE